MSEDSQSTYDADPHDRWDEERAVTWYRDQGFKAGVNFIPSYASNQLEMFQDRTYDIDCIERELKWASELGFSVLRVYLHHLLWFDYHERFLQRLDEFLTIASCLGFSVIFVFFDSCWNSVAFSGPQPDPTPGVHNSRWLQCPGKDILDDVSRFDALKQYVQCIVSYFKNDHRVVMWDIWNEPNNSGYLDVVINPLLKKAFGWAREIQPCQPLTTGIWQTMVREIAKPFQTLQLQLSDVVTFHCYESSLRLQLSIEFLRRQEPRRPLICTEYMARTNESTFNPQLKMLKDANAWAISWGLVSGRSQTIFPWTTINHPSSEVEPTVWFHDFLRRDGSPFDQKEVEYIKSVLLPADDGPARR